MLQALPATTVVDVFVCLGRIRLPFAYSTSRSWQDNLALTTDRVLIYRTGRIGVCLIASMIYIAFLSVELFVPDWTEENKAEADANLAKDIYYNDDEEVGSLLLLRHFSYCDYRRDDWFIDK